MESHITLQELQRYIKQRDHKPKMAHQYMLKLMEEVGELAEAIRKDKRMGTDGKIKGTIEEELYDVLYYVMAIANQYEVDMEQCFQLKEALNQKKYAKKQRGEK